MPKYDLEKLTKGLSVSAGIAYNNYMADSSIKNQNYARYSLSKGAGGEVLYTPYGADSPLESDEGFRTDWSRLTLRHSWIMSRFQATSTHCQHLFPV